MKRKIFVFMMIYLLIAAPFFSQNKYKAEWSSLDTRETPQWWQDAKFGIFIHWGLYSVPAYAPMDQVNEIYQKYSEHYWARLISGNQLFKDFHSKHYGDNFSYTDFAPLFKAEYFNPDEWADLFKKAGAKYVVLTSKHHDGFCLWKSKYSPRWNSVEIGPHRDLLGELSESVRRQELHMGYYYSLLEWEHPLYTKSTINKWTENHMIPQLKELVNNYRPEIIFSDGEWDYDSQVWKSEEFLAWLYNDSPVKNTVVVNDRWGKETRSKNGDYYTTEYDLVHDKKGIGDNANYPWEESRGIGTSYGYNRFETTEHYLTSKQLIDILIDKVSTGGNFLLNIGPDANGLIPVVMQERLLDIGEWLKINGEAIYASQPWHSQYKPKNENLAFTKRDGNLYVIIKKWQKEPIVLQNLKKAEKIELLGYSGAVTSIFKEGTLTIRPPVLTIDELPSVHAWVLKISSFKE